MAYIRTEWENNQTPLSAENMNNIEDGIEESMENAASANAAAGKAYDRIHLSTAEPTAADGIDGDVWIMYTEG